MQTASLKRQPKPTRSFRTARSAALTISSDTRVSTPQWEAAAFRAAVSRTSSAMSSAIFLAVVEGGVVKDRSAVQTCAIPWRSLSRTRCAVPQPRFACHHYSTVRPVTVVVPSRVAAPSHVAAVVALVRCAASKGFFRCSRPAPNAVGAGRPSLTLAWSVAARDW